MSSFWRKLPKPIKILAPMEDVTDTVFRQIVARCGRPDVFFTEFTSTDGLCSRGRPGVISRLKFTEVERPLVAQIWGNNPKNYYDSAILISQMGFDGIDINMGCPVPKIIKGGACSALIENKNLAKEIILAAMEGAGKLPVSVKTRIGFRRTETEEWAEWLLKLNPAALTIHGRTAREMSKVPARWGEIAKVVAIRDGMESETIIIGNGDVRSPQDLAHRVATTKVDGVMIGRGIFDNLFIFDPDIERQIKQQGDLKLKLSLLLEHARLYKETWGENRDFAVLKKFIKVYVSGFAGAGDLRARLMKVEGLAELEQVVFETRDHFTSPINNGIIY